MKVSIYELKGNIIRANLRNRSLRPKRKRQIDHLALQLRKRALNGGRIKLSTLINMVNEVVPYRGWKYIYEDEKEKVSRTLPKEKEMTKNPQDPASSQMNMLEV